MPDASHLPPEAPRDWAAAFAALHAESPPADAWANLSGALDARRRPRRIPAWLGLAAAAAIVAVIAWPDPPAATRVNPVVRGTPSIAAHAAPTSAAPARVGATEVATVIPPEGREPDPPATPSATPRTRIPTSQVGASAAPTTRMPAAPASGLPALQQESARLESLLAVARDERVGNASALLLADALDTQVASIDASLADPAVGDAEREALWQARVDALQQAAGFAGTQRLMAAQGYEDTLMVSVD
jgi:hypothetical protein